MPFELEGEAAELWRSVVPRLCRAGVVSAVDVPALTDMCLTWKALRECESQLDREGRVVDGYRGSRVKHPLTSVVKSYRESWQKYAQKFGLQPVDRQRLPTPEDEPGPSLADVLHAAVWKVAGDDEDVLDLRAERGDDAG